MTANKNLTDKETTELISSWDKNLWEDVDKVFGSNLVSKLSVSKFFKGKKYLLVRLLMAVYNKSISQEVDTLREELDELRQSMALLERDNGRLSTHSLVLMKILQDNKAFTFSAKEFIDQINQFNVCNAVVGFLNRTGRIDTTSTTEKEDETSGDEVLDKLMADELTKEKLLEMKPHDTQGRKHPKGSKIFNG